MGAGARQITAALLCVSLTLSACAGSSDAPQQAGRLEWQSCEEGEYEVELECATLEVPNDHGASNGLTQRLAVARARASGPGSRLGVLLFNLGGPGSESTRVLRSFHALLSRSAPELVARFDLVAFDPRGIGRSTPPLRYLEDETLARMRALDLTPDDESERFLHDRLADEVLASAQELDARYAARVDTESVARDVDLLRAALGAETISYYGGSYGTLLGALYATLFPARVRAFVLDSPVMPVVDRRELMRAQAASFERAYDAFVAWCGETDACALHDLGADGLTQTFDSLIEETPIVIGDRTLSGSDILTAMGQALSSGKNVWPALAERLLVLLDGDGESVLASADGWYGRTPDGTYGDDIVDAFTAISALDAPYPPDFDRGAFDAFVDDEVLGAGAHFARVIALNERISIGWPFEKGRALPNVDARSAPPALVLAGLDDPSTPVSFAYEMRDALGNGSSLLTYDDSTHGQFFASTCVRDAAVAFLLEPGATEDAGCAFEPAAGSP
jgi:pimeloyl-ACP methyl ester carboxylesterase